MHQRLRPADRAGRQPERAPASAVCSLYCTPPFGRAVTMVFAFAAEATRPAYGTFEVHKKMLHSSEWFR